MARSVGPSRPGDDAAAMLSGVPTVAASTAPAPAAERTGGGEDTGVTEKRSIGVRVRDAGPDDAFQLAELNRHVQQPHRDAEPDEFTEHDPAAALGYFRERLQAPGFWAALAEVHGAGVGYLLAEVIRRPANPFGGPTEALYVHHVGVAPAFRRLGVGRALIGRAEEYARENGLSGVRLDTWSSNRQAQDFFAALGYTEYIARLRKDLGLEPVGPAGDIDEAAPEDIEIDDDEGSAEVLSFPAPQERPPLDLSTLDLDDLASTLSDQGGDWGHSWLFDPGTGELHLHSADGTLDGEEGVDLDELDLIRVDPVPSRVWYGDMVDFIEGISDEQAGRRLGRAIQGRGAFRRFRDELHDEYPHLVAVWRAFSDNRGRCRAVEWLADEGLITDEAAQAYYGAHPDPQLP